MFLWFFFYSYWIFHEFFLTFWCCFLTQWFHWQLLLMLFTIMALDVFFEQNSTYCPLCLDTVRVYLNTIVKEYFRFFKGNALFQSSQRHMAPRSISVLIFMHSIKKIKGDLSSKSAAHFGSGFLPAWLMPHRLGRERAREMCQLIILCGVSGKRMDGCS